MFGLEGSGFFLSIAFTLLLAGAIVFFMNGRVKDLRASLVNQASVLTQLVNEFKYQAGGASPEALDAARYLHLASTDAPEACSGTIKIDVSDDSCSESSCSDSESDADHGCIVGVAGDSQCSPIICSPTPEDAGNTGTVKTITLSDVEDLSSLNVDSTEAAPAPGSEVSCIEDLTSVIAMNPGYLGALKVGEARALANKILGENNEHKKTRKADILEALQKAVSAHAASVLTAEKV